MTTTTTSPLAELYEKDETAWLDEMARLASDGRHADLDLVNLGDYLEAMARSDRHEVYNRLVTLLAHLLKREHQPERHSRSWELTILEQRRELRQWLESGTLRNHAASVLHVAFRDARKEAAVETGLPLKSLPETCRWSIDELLTDDDQV